MGSITSSTVITNLSVLTWPLTISASNITVTLGTDLTFNTLSQYFIIGAGITNITIDGQNYNINMSGMVGYIGLVQNTNILNTNITIKNINVVCDSISSLTATNGWLTGTAFVNGTILFCNSNGSIPVNGGGICGSNTYLTSCINCYSMGSIGQFSGGIFGPYSLNCNATNCYSSGNIGQYAGGIFGFGTNYIWDGTVYSPSDIVDQSGNPGINALNPLSAYSPVTILSTVTSSYSLGSIGQYAGGIFGYFSYSVTVTNSFSAGTGTDSSAGGIYALNFYYNGSIMTPLTCLCSAINCYVSGGGMSTDGIFSFSGTNNSGNVRTNCYSELYTSPYIVGWNSCHALTCLTGLGVTWIKISCDKKSIWLLKTFCNKLYSKNCKKISCKNGKSKKGLYSAMYHIWNMKNKSIKIDCYDGRLTFHKVKCGKYKIKIINGTKIQMGTYCNNNFTWINYRLGEYFLKSTYKPKCKSSSTSSTSSSSSCSKSFSTKSCSTYSTSSTTNSSKTFSTKCHKIRKSCKKN